MPTISADSAWLALAAAAGGCIALQATANAALKTQLGDARYAAFFSICGTILSATLFMLVVRPAAPATAAAAADDGMQQRMHATRRERAARWALPGTFAKHCSCACSSLSPCTQHPTHPVTHVPSIHSASENLRPVTAVGMGRLHTSARS